MRTRKGTTKSRGRKDELDRFYAKGAVAAACVDAVAINDFDVVIEPSVGSGSFAHILTGKGANVLAIDINPPEDADDIVAMDWFDYERERGDGNVLVIGNPPFGQHGTASPSPSSIMRRSSLTSSPSSFRGRLRRRAFRGGLTPISTS